MRLVLVPLVWLLIAAPAVAAPGLLRVVQDDNVLLRSGPAARDAALDELAALEVDVIRVNLVWRELDRSPSRWRDVAALVAAVRARGLRPLITLTTPAPRWASPPHGAARDGTWRPDVGGFKRFARTAAEHLGSQVDLWSLVNEPNSPNQLMPQHRGGRPYSPYLYRRLVRAALPHLPGDVLLGEELGVVNGRRGARAPVAPRRFMRELLCLDRRDRPSRSGPGCARRFAPLDVDGWSVHPYYPPRTPLAVPRRRDTVFPRTLRRLLPTLDAAARHGRIIRAIDLWDTEGGSQTAPPDRIFGVPLGVHARNLNVTEALAWRTPRLRSWSQYLLRDDRPLHGFQSGLRFRSGRAKPALAAYRLPISARRRGGHAVVVTRTLRSGPPATLRGVELARGYSRTRVRIGDGRTVLRVLQGSYRSRRVVLKGR